VVGIVAVGVPVFFALGGGDSLKIGNGVGDTAGLIIGGKLGIGRETGVSAGVGVGVCVGIGVAVIVDVMGGVVFGVARRREWGPGVIGRTGSKYCV